jgi:hypothetical protein
MLNSAVKVNLVCQAAKRWKKRVIFVNPVEEQFLGRIVVLTPKK